MFAFYPLEEIYALISQRINEYSDKHRILTKCEVVDVDRQTNGVRVTWVKKEGGESYTEHFDHVVFACGAEATLKILSTKATFFERWVLGSVRYYDDVTYTHTDRDYMNKHYSLKPESSSETPMFFIKSYEGYDLRRVEMSFNLCAYQPFLKQAADKEGVDVYQTIFLDAARDQGQVWTENEIDSKKIIAKTWWLQFAHDWTHYLKVVPFVSLIQGQSGCTWHCGAWTAVNTHEIAIVSGLAIAQRLGAAYPFADDELASHQFNLYMFVAHEIFPSLSRKIKFVMLLMLISMLVYVSMGILN